MASDSSFIYIYDTTLRDGTQRENIALSVEDKLRVARALSHFGVHYIELGFPYASPKEAELFKKAQKEDFGSSRIVAFGSTRRKDKSAAADPNLRAIVQSGADVACIFGKSWDFHVRKVLEASLDENLAMISESIGFLKDHFSEVIFDAEHFFDGFKENPGYALQTLKVAQEAGADWIVLCDTNGGCIPTEIEEMFEAVRQELGPMKLGIHAHNDSACAVANSLVAVECGATMVQGTINGYGERCGNADLCAVIPNLVFKMGYECVPRENLKLLTDLSRFVSEIANLTPDPHQPYVGQSAFAHKGGMHVSAVAKDPRTFEHIDPSLIGNTQRVLVSELSGKGTIIRKAKEMGIDLSSSSEKVARILAKIQDLEHKGYHFEAADGSFELLLKEEVGLLKEYFKLESFRVLMEKRQDGKVETEATIKLRVGNRRIISTAEGNGPVNALDNAIREAITRAYPDIKRIRLTDFKVRVIDEKKGTAAIVRVLIDSTDGKTTWSTVGVSENIIEASWEALEDSIILGLMRIEQEGLSSSSE